MTVASQLLINSRQWRYSNINVGFIPIPETEEGIAQAIIRGKIDFQKDTWQKVSEEAKLLVKNMLDPNPYNRLTVEEVLGIYVMYLYRSMHA